MIIVGLTGSIGSGKTTFARLLGKHASKSAHWESWQLVAEVVNALRRQKIASPPADDIKAINNWLQALPKIVADACHTVVQFDEIRLTPPQLTANPENYAKLLEYLRLVAAQPELRNGSITEANKDDLRPILQWLGGYLVKTVGAGIWYDEIIRRVQATPELELATIGGVRFPGDARRVKAAGGYMIELRRPQIAIRDAQDLTERERSYIHVDSIIHNNGNLEQLDHCAFRLMKDLRTGKLASEYLATS